MKCIELSYTMGNQTTFDTRPNTLEGLKSALRQIAKRERMGWKCSPGQIEIKHLIENYGNTNI